MEAIRTGYSHGISATLKYIGDDTTPAHKNNNGVIYRNLYTTGIGVRSNGIKNTIDDFNRLNKKRRHNKVKSVNIVLSPAPNEVNPNDPGQVQDLAEYAKDFVRKAYPHHLAYIGVQDDNQNKRPHVHCIISAISTITPYRALTRHQCDIYRIRKIADKVRKQFNKNHTDIHFSGMTYNGEHTINKHSFNRFDEINKRMTPILDALNHGRYSSIKDFISQAKLHGVNVKPKYKRLAKRNSNGKIIYKRYKTGKRRGKYKYHKNKNGNYVKSKILGKTKLVGFAFQALPSSYIDTRKRNKSNRKFRYVRGFNMSKLNPNFKSKHIIRCIKHSTELSAEFKSKPNPNPKPKSSAYIAPKYNKINNRASSASIQPRTNQSVIQSESAWLNQDLPDYKPIIKDTVNRTTTHSNYNRVARSIPLIIQTTPCGQDRYGDEVFSAINQQTHATPKQVGILGRMRSWIKDKTRMVYAKIRKPMIRFAKHLVGTAEVEHHIPLDYANGSGGNALDDLSNNTANLEPHISYHWYNKSHQFKKYKSIHTRFKHWVGSTLLQFSHNIDTWLMPQYRLIHKHQAKLSSSSSASTSESASLSEYGNAILSSERANITSKPTTIDKIDTKFQSQINTNKHNHQNKQNYGPNRKE